MEEEVGSLPSGGKVQCLLVLREWRKKKSALDASMLVKLRRKEMDLEPSLLAHSYFARKNAATLQIRVFLVYVCWFQMSLMSLGPI
jgi:hypothetical protein